MPSNSPDKFFVAQDGFDFLNFIFIFSNLEWFCLVSIDSCSTLEWLLLCFKLGVSLLERTSSKYPPMRETVEAVISINKSFKNGLKFMERSSNIDHISTYCNIPSVLLGKLEGMPQSDRKLQVTSLS